MLIAVTRPVSASFADCELTHLARQPIDLARAERQHAEYERALEVLGCEIHRLPAARDLPDAVFVEDAAVVLDQIAILTRPGAASRRPEVPSVAAALAAWRPTASIEAPGTLDGGDVLCVGRRIFVGQSGRTNDAGFDQFHAIAGRFGYRAERVPVAGCLHLKSAVTAVGPDTLLINPAWVSRYPFMRAARGEDGTASPGFDVIEVDPAEPGGANALLVGDGVIYSSAFPRTAHRLGRHGIEPLLVDVSEIAKAEGALTCCSLIVAIP
jgi:dimethylargininase